MALFDFLKKKELEEIQNLKNTIIEKDQLIEKLSKWQSIVDAEEKAKEILADAYREAEISVSKAKGEALRLTKEADEILKIANEESENTRKLAMAYASGLESRAEHILNEASINEKRIIKEAQSKAEYILNQATRNEEKIIKEAQIKAEEIAGEAYKLKNEADNLKNTVQALNNKIKGYGDEYIIPSYSLLDDLAQDYGFTQAGDDLKNARERTKAMVKNGTAAKCEYVETYRKDTAINFVTDAFNGKVDSILSSIKHDNFGILKQKIVDAYHLVNNLGRAFRNAVITETYLSSRIDELKYSVLVMEIKRKEQEEQRQIKEQLREEEKARREIEKALRDAAKEEEMLTKAMEKLKSQMDKASEEQKAKYESQIAELEQKWKEAEERNQRALSMAQQTKSGHVYVISNVGSFGENVYKIGMTRRLEPSDRVRELGDASVPFPFDIHAMIWSENAPELENNLHKYFLKAQMNKVNPRKEFFKIPIQEIRTHIEGLEVQTKWSMIAEAAEYRESMAIEKSLETNKELQEKWELSQANQLVEELEEVED
jgi:hypothetical protein